MNSLRIRGFLCLVLASLLTGCATYLTPGGPAPLAEFQADRATATDNGVPSVRAVPSFPATIAVVRVQAPQFPVRLPEESRSGKRFSVVTSAESSVPASLQSMSLWPEVASVVQIDPSTLPVAFESPADLRLAAAKMSAGILLVYTVESSFRAEGRVYGPVTSFSINGAKPGGDAAITVTASAVFTDVRTGATLGTASATALNSDWASARPSAETIDLKRRETEHKACELLLADAQNTWADITRRYH